MNKLRSIAIILSAIGIASVAYKYFEHDFDFSFGLEENDEDV